jgi:thiol-disulfide isomerase/thioredoxin
MRRLIISLSIILVIIGCNKHEEKEKGKTIIVTGIITNPIVSEVFVKNKEILEKSIIDTNGVFKIKFFLDKPAFFSFHEDENAPLFLSPGDSIYITLNTDQFDETLSFSGIGSEINNYLIKKYLVFEELFYNHERDIFSLGSIEYVKRIDSIFNILEGNFDHFISGNNKKINKIFANQEESILKINRANYLFYYSKEHKLATGKNAFMNKDYYSFIREFNLNDSTLFGLDEYRSFLKNTIEILAKEENLNNQHNDAATIINVILNKFENEKIKNFMLAWISQELIQESKVDDNLMDIIRQDLIDTKYIKGTEKIYEKMKKLSEGSPAPEFSYEDIKGNMVSLSDFYGKYVYIDVWSTKCGPCIKEIPLLNQLEEEYKDKNIVFISMSIDNQIEDWKRMVNEEKLKGIHLHATNGWRSTFAIDYYIRSTPTYILIDNMGKVVAVRAPRPSESIRELFDKFEL